MNYNRTPLAEKVIIVALSLTLVMACAWAVTLTASLTGIKPFFVCLAMAAVVAAWEIAERKRK